ncbi:MAG: TonB-dependent receptor plug domain-containing protein, partial [Amphiplicatus sp.]
MMERIFCGALISIVSLASPAHAADEIIVMATKRAQRLEDIPASIDALTGAAAEKATDYDSAEEIAQRLAGVQAAVANGNQIAFQIRGVGAVDHQALTPTAAAVYMDGVFLATNVQTGPLLYDLERIEVLKGPQGALYGRNASSGAVNFLSARPTDT